MKEDKIKEVYNKEEDISKIIELLKPFSFNNLKKTSHFYHSLDEKATDISILKENFKDFERIRLINKREHRNGEISYDLYYEMDLGYLVYCIKLDKVPVLLNGFHVKRDLKKFREHLLRKFKK